MKIYFYVSCKRRYLLFHFSELGDENVYILEKKVNYLDSIRKSRQTMNKRNCIPWRWKDKLYFKRLSSQMAIHWKILKFQPGGRSVKVERGDNSSFAEVYQAINGELWFLDHLYTRVQSFTILSFSVVFHQYHWTFSFFLFIKFHYDLQIIFLKPII